MLHRMQIDNTGLLLGHVQVHTLNFKDTKRSAKSLTSQ